MIDRPPRHGVSGASATRPRLRCYGCREFFYYGEEAVIEGVTMHLMGRCEKCLAHLIVTCIEMMKAGEEPYPASMIAYERWDHERESQGAA